MLETVDLAKGVNGVSGSWRTCDDINVWDIEKKDIYRSSIEPSFVCWAILWKEAEGTVKLSFTEATGGLAAWPPTYHFNSRDIEYYLKTLVSQDGGRTWTDTGWREDLDPLWEINPDHHIRHVFQAQDGSLIRNYCHTIEGITTPTRETVYDESKVQSDFPFTDRVAEALHPKFASTWRSLDGGKTWEEIHLDRRDPPFFVGGIHQIGNGSIVATGAFRNDEVTGEAWSVGITESWDGGRSWTEPQVIAENDDVLLRQGIGEESDFVELADGRLLMIQRTDGRGMNTLQRYLTRDAAGTWHATTPTTNPLFVHSGYPHLHRASDGTIFYYCHTSIKYTCNDGLTWHELPLGYSYYGQIVEASPGRILAVTQKNIGDCPYPWKHDTSMLQATFNYARTPVLEQTDAEPLAAIALIDADVTEDFHAYAEMRVDGETGIVFHADGKSYGFAAVVIPCNEFRAPGRAAGKEQDAMLVIGRSESGALTILRRIHIGKVVPGSWIEMQLDKSEGLLKVAVKISEGDFVSGKPPATYTMLREDFGDPGKLGFFTNRSTGAFKNVRIGAGGVEIRSNWRSASEAARRLALDAGRQE